MSGIWVLGGTGRTGRVIAEELLARGMSPVLVGRDQARLDELAEKLGARTRVVASASAVPAAVAEERPSVVVNTIGPFSGTALPIARACLRGTHYLDLSNELAAVTGVLDLHEEAVAAGSCLVPGAGFGVLGTESVVLRLCAGQPAPERVRVDAVASVAMEEGIFGEALAASLLDGLTGGSRRYAGGRLVRARLGSGFERLTLPDGTTVGTTAWPSGELEVACRASGAPDVVAATGAMPSGRLVRALLPGVAALVSVPPLRRALKRRLAAMRVKARPAPREFTWARARAWWPDGSTREGWLRAGEGMAFTAAVAAEVAARLARGEGRPGARTPGAMFGPELAEAAGGRFVPGA
ncbi:MULTISPECIES: saccharopine dehydrogenase NADP-binding domain-containing protein [Amycolatopsis]|uniref:Saccharopine dehydrogenase NADP-binding domain-containing protein n=1 Tax=Amycolatopsis dongchuanensis TaxID=1070866 RepID=A0ABP8VR73_9PSEU